jgi:hypothetical protein
MLGREGERAASCAAGFPGIPCGAAEAIDARRKRTATVVDFKVRIAERFYSADEGSAHRRPFDPCYRSAIDSRRSASERFHTFRRREP